MRKSPKTGKYGPEYTPQGYVQKRKLFVVIVSWLRINQRKISH